VPYLTDTDVLLRDANKNDPANPLCRQAVDTLIANGERLYYTQQKRRELWNVCTRPVANNGLGLTVAQAVAWLAQIDTISARLPDVPASGPEWDRLVVQYQVMGKGVHDAQLVAAMCVHGITHLLTLNVADFARYAPEITVVHPKDV
jgi:predicted nucleic acid-binding protein